MGGVGAGVWPWVGPGLRASIPTSRDKCKEDEVEYEEKSKGGTSFGSHLKILVVASVCYLLSPSALVNYLSLKDECLWRWELFAVNGVYTRGV